MKCATEALCYKPEGRGFKSRWVIALFNWPNPFSRNIELGISPSLTDEYQDSSCGVNRSRSVRLLTSPPTMSRLSDTCWSLYVSQHYRHLRSVIEIASLTFLLEYYAINKIINELSYLNTMPWIMKGEWKCNVRTIPTERSPLVGNVSANVYG
jgi:hypothetical protein